MRTFVVTKPPREDDDDDDDDDDEEEEKEDDDDDDDDDSVQIGPRFFLHKRNNKETCADEDCNSPCHHCHQCHQSRPIPSIEV